MVLVVPKISGYRLSYIGENQIVSSYSLTGLLSQLLILEVTCPLMALGSNLGGQSSPVRYVGKLMGASCISTN